MGKIGKLTGKSGGSRVTIYPITIPQAVVDPTTKKKLRDELDEIKQAAAGGIEEAPKDGKYYARKNGAWADVNTPTLSLTINTNQSSRTDVASVKATVTHDGTSTQMGHGDRLELIKNKTYTITFPEVANYKKPDNITFVVDRDGLFDMVGTYQTEVVTVSVTAEDSSSVAGQVVTINGEAITLTASGIATNKVPFGTEYSISVDSKSGYWKPSVQTFTASQSFRNVTMAYKIVPLGVYIQDKSGNLWTTDQWDSNNNANANAIAVITANIQVLVSLKEINNRFTDTYDTPFENYCNAVSDEAVAKVDYNGKENTANILKTIDGFIAGWATNFKFPDGTTGGYIPALGELREIYLNRTAINNALSACGATTMDKTSYWSSTFNRVDAYRYFWKHLWGMDSVGGEKSINYNIYVRAFKQN